MKKFLVARRKLKRSEVLAIFCFAFLLLLLSVASVAALILKRANNNLVKRGVELSGKVSSLQGDLRGIGEALSGKATADEANAKKADSSAPAVLSRIGLIATPGETALSVDTPAGWELVGENRLRSGASTIAVQSEDIDLLSISNYQVSRTVESFNLKSGATVFLVFIKTTEDNKGYLSLSFCNPDVGPACSFRGRDGKYVFILAHGYKDKDQFVRDMDFNTAEGIKLITGFKVMMKSLEIR